MKATLPLLCLLGAGLLPVRAADTVFTEDFAGTVPRDNWRFFEENWAIETFEGQPGLAPHPTQGESWLRPMNIAFRQNDSEADILPLTVDFDVIAFANNAQSNRFSLLLYCDEAASVTMYGVMIQPGLPVEILKEGGGMEPQVLATGQEVSLPKGKPVKISLIWDKDSKLEVKIGGQSVAKTDEAVPAHPAPFALRLWERFGEKQPENRVIFRKIVVTYAKP